MKYIVIKNHFHINEMHLQGEQREYPLHVANQLLESGYISEPIKAELKEIKKKTTRKTKK